MRRVQVQPHSNRTPSDGAIDMEWHERVEVAGGGSVGAVGNAYITTSIHLHPGLIMYAKMDVFAGVSIQTRIGAVGL